MYGHMEKIDLEDVRNKRSKGEMRDKRGGGKNSSTEVMRGKNESAELGICQKVNERKSSQ